MKGFFYGLGLGVALGVLFAPMSGEETRNNLKEKAGDLGDNARQFADQAKDKANQYVDSAKSAVDQGKDKLRQGVQSIRGQASDAAQSATSNQPATGTTGSSSY